MRYTLLFILVGWLPSCLWAQKVIEGKISSEEEVLAFAVIKLEDASNVEIQALLSDDTGQFTFFPAETGTYSIISSMVGYQSDATTL